jgi:hypothetical protein
VLSLKESKRRVAMFNAIQDAKNELERVQHDYLRACGWEYTSATPGCLWLWQKATPPPRDPRDAKRHVAGRIMLLSTDTAFAMQRSWDDIELDDRAFAEVE